MVYKEAKLKKCKNYEVCGNAFKQFASTDRFCSPSCAYSQPKQPKSALTKTQRDKAKENARKRDRGFCRLQDLLPDDLKHAKHRIKLEVHHIIFLSEEVIDEVWNLVQLCEHCHKQIAHKYKNDWQWKLLVIVNGKDWINKVPGKWLSMEIGKKINYLWTKTIENAV